MQGIERQLKIYKTATFLLFCVIVIVGIVTIVSKSSKSSSATANQNLLQKAKPTAEAKVEKGFDFAIKKGGKDNFRIRIDKATLVKLVTSKGKPIIARDGESFLLVYLEIENNLQTPLLVNSQNYFRLINENDKRFASDFYNGATQVSAIATKKDQIGFVVKEGLKEYKLQVGEIDGKKEVVIIKF